MYCETQKKAVIGFMYRSSIGLSMIMVKKILHSNISSGLALRIFYTSGRDDFGNAV